MELQGKKVLVFGIRQKRDRSMLHLLAKAGAVPVIYDGNDRY